MAILKNTIIAASVLASYALAVPLANVNKREMVWKTWTETAWVTQNVHATVWVDDKGKPVRTDMPAFQGGPTVQPASPSSTTSVSVAANTAPVAPPALPASSAPAAAPAASSAAPSPAYSPAGFATVASPAPSPAMASSAPASAAAAPVASTSAVARASSGGSGVCQGEGSGCSGDITHWDGGLGACGWNVDTNSDMEIAMPVGLMGAQSNGNPYCGRSLTIKGPAGNLVQATVGDKCMGCSGDSIDLTNALFTAVAPNGDGRVSNIEWWFN